VPVQPVVDLRSDTLTRPTEGMRRAMAVADVGDDGYGEDPSVNALEAEVAELFGHGGAVFVPSGTMGNQIALQLLCGRGEELLCDAGAHVVSYEGGGLAAYSGILTRTMVVPRGLLNVDVVRPQIRLPGFHAGATATVAVEQTHMRGSGAVYPLETLRQLRALTAERGVSLYCDGARIWNAHVASGVSFREYGAQFDAMSVCLSKGLGAPVGSLVLVKDPARLEAARDVRHRLGGAMRQAGIIAAGGLYALHNQLDRLVEDHARARRLAVGLADAVPGLVDPDQVETNMVMLDLASASASVDATELGAACRAEGVLVSLLGPTTVRLVTHLDVDDADVERALAVIRTALLKRRA
jgi:threonine aldolase